MYVHTAIHRPVVTHPDTRRDKKETARRAALPQPGGRFRWWWQVLGSNQRRLSRRFYRPLVGIVGPGISLCRITWPAGTTCHSACQDGANVSVIARGAGPVQPR